MTTTLAHPLRLSDDHPIRSARWIWPASMFELVNCFAEFRKDFTLAKVPKKAPFAITADQHYRLWVNGAFVCRGPARGYQTSWPVDEVDIAPFLRAGANWISIEAYTPGVSTFKYLHQGVAGMICAGTFGGVAIVSNGTWSMRRAAHRLPSRRLSLQLDFQEHVDLARLQRGWISDAVTAGTWGLPEPLDGAQPGEVLPGRPPWDDLEGRGIPLMKHAVRAPLRVAARTTGTSGTDIGGGHWRSWQDVSWPWQREAEKLAWTATDEREQSDGALVVTIPAAGADGFAAAAVDMGEYVMGNLLVDVDGGETGAVIDLHYHETFVDGRPDRRRPGEACCIALAGRLVLAPGRHSHEFFHLLAFTAVTVVARGTTQPVTVRLRVRTAGYPFAMRGGFTSSDETLDNIHAASRRTQQLCAQDAYVDTPWREQAQWWGDARVQARNTFFLDGDARLLARGIRSLAGQRGPSGLTYGHAPTMAHNCILPDFSLTWILTIWDHYWQTGDTDLIHELWPRIQEVLGYFADPKLRHKSGLLLHDRRLWYFGDWAELSKGDVPTFLNLWYLLTLRQLAILLKTARMPKEAAAIAKQAAAHEKAVLKHLVDHRRGLMSAGLGAAEEPGVHEQTLAVLMDLVPEHHDAMASKRLLPWIRGEAFPDQVAGKNIAVPSAFWATYVFDALGARGNAAEVISCIRTRWQPMLATGTTWEDFKWSENGGSSASHAWTAHPSSHLVAWLAGIRQSGPAWTRIIIQPTFIPGIDHASGLVPTPQGDVSVRWERKGGTVTVAASVPKSVVVDLRLPGAKAEIWKGGGKKKWTVKLAELAVAKG
jgi:hypothetical protein